MRLRILSRRDLAISLFALSLLLFVESADAVVRRVNVQGTGDFPTIQAAIEASAKGDTVLVAPGHYTWTNQGSGDEFGLIVYWQSLRDEIDLVSEAGPEVTILDAEGQGRVFFANGNTVAVDPVDFVIDGFTLQNGNAPLYENRIDREGGGMALHLVEPLIRNCIFYNNKAEYGGAVWAGGQNSIRFEDCQFIENQSTTTRTVNVFGGGVNVLNSPMLTVFERCTFIGNTTEYRGGGIMIYNARVDMIDCLFTDNSSSHPVLASGSAIYAFDTHEVNFERILVRGNDTTVGTAIRLLHINSVDMDVNMNHSLIADNVPGGAVEVVDTTFDVTCTNIHGHPRGDWLGVLLVQLGQNDNTSLDPMFCAGSEYPRWVRSASPMLAANNACGEDLGAVMGGCSTVAVAVSGFEAGWDGPRAQFRLQLEGEPGDVERLSLTRQEPGKLAVEIPSTWRWDGSSLWASDAEAPSSGALYRVRWDGEVVAEAQLGAKNVNPPRTGIVSIAPNPSNPRSTIEWATSQEGWVSLRILDLRGRLVATLEDRHARTGSHRTVWSGVDDAGQAVVSGVYLVDFSGPGGHQRQKLALVR